MSEIVDPPLLQWFIKTHGTIYLVTNLINGKQYIGQTTRPLAERWRQHMSGAATGTTALQRAIRKHGKENFHLRELSRVCMADGLDLMNKLESDAIVIWNTLVPHGYNLNSGGANGRLHESTKRKISESLKGHVVSDYVRQRSREVHAGNQYSKGRPVSSETRAKLSEKLKGRFTDKVFSLETRAKISTGLKGRLVSDETRARISAGKKGKPSNRKWSKHTLESRAKMSASHKGVPMSPERRANMCKAQQIRRAAEKWARENSQS